ncbi:TonB-dependent receptor plug domain-containing protein [Tenacibaculum sp. C7A-26P2]|uniref:TonB-dependent receptor plug domain-containing protein n=1 Tax=Tenacibaculum sp. C7A-26P2 TaxID=3447504 RepID=UPI003F82B56E
MFLNKLYLFFLLFCGAIFSQVDLEKKQDTTNINSNNQLDEVIVTATRTKRQLSSLPMPVTLITKKQIKEIGSVRLRDILLEQTGVTLVRENAGNSEGIQLQGIAADYTLIMIDGVPVVGRTAGNIDLNRITVNNIKQIEIVKGPSSSLYGSEAMGGVINIITERPKNDTFKGQYHVLTRGGSRNELDINSNISYRKSKLGIIGGVNLNSSGGFDLTPQTSPKTVYPHQNYTLNAQVLYDISNSLNFDTSFRYYNQDQFISSGITNSQTDFNSNTKLIHKLSDRWNIDYTFYATRFKTISDFYGNTSLFDRSLFRPEIRSDYSFLNTATLIFGGGVNIDALDRTFIDKGKKFKAWYGFVQLDFNPTEKINIVYGARYEGSDSYQSAFTPKISANYELNDIISVRGSVGYGFKIPDFRQLFFNFRNVNNGYIVLGTHTINDEITNGLDTVVQVERNLKPESSIGYNFGFQIKPVEGLRININAFRNDINDLIDSYDTKLLSRSLEDLSPEVVEVQKELRRRIGISEDRHIRVFTYRNFKETFTQGIEVDINYKINKNLRFLAGYQFLDTGNKVEIDEIKKGVYYKDENGISQKLDPSAYFGLANRSRHMLNAKIFYENFQHKFAVNLRGIYRSEFVPMDSNNNDLIDTYDNFVKPNTQINFAVNKELFGLVNLQFGIDNLFNYDGLNNKELFNFSNPNGGGVVPNESFLQLGRSYYVRTQINI